MNIKTIAIFVHTWFYPTFHWDETNYENGGIGGSEIWAIRTSDELSRMGYGVYLFGNPRESHISKSGVKYLSYLLYKPMSEEIKFDYFIFSRMFPDNINEIKSDNIFIMPHDMTIFNMPYNYNDEIGKIKKIFCLSDYQKKQIQKNHPYLPDSIFCYTKNGVDSYLYEKYKDLPKKNQMVCSSGNQRQAMWITTKVFPLIKKEVPDFELILCHYLDTFDEDMYKQNGIKIVGDVNNPISKENLVKVQCESKIWIYGNTHSYGMSDTYFNETFCITAIEAACAKSAIIVGEDSPFTQTLLGYNNMICKDLFPSSIEEIMSDENQEIFARKIADMSIKCLKDENYRQFLVNETYEIGIKTSWENATKYIINELKKYQ